MESKPKKSIELLTKLITKQINGLKEQKKDVKLNEDGINPKDIIETTTYKPGDSIHKEIFNRLPLSQFKKTKLMNELEGKTFHSKEAKNLYYKDLKDKENKLKVLLKSNRKLLEELDRNRHFLKEPKNDNELNIKYLIQKLRNHGYNKYYQPEKPKVIKEVIKEDEVIDEDES